jgi:tetratricopeptide (TPR) repeat protein
MSIESTLPRRMTATREESSGTTFVPVLLPWLVAVAGLMVYFWTFNHWVTLNGVSLVAKTSGWTWQPELNEPLFWLATYPFRWLPPTAIPSALNLFAMACAVLTLALLARSVTLLPHDRTEEQRAREKNLHGMLSLRSAWLPPVLAAAVCGLQLTFWENATAASGEMFDLLLFAYIIRCLLEFRLEHRHSWLFRAAMVYGAAMANNWAMVGFLPVFLVGLIWLKGVSFFNVRFLMRIFLLGLAGSSLYLVLPLAAAWSHAGVIGFWPALKFNLSSQKSIVTYLLLNKYTLFYGDRPLWVLALPSLLPVLAAAIKWPSYFGDPSKLGVTMATLIFHVLHGVLLLVCLWVTLDPAFGPRSYLQNALPLLTLYYLGALSVGYYCGYFLVVFGAKPVGRPRVVEWYEQWLNTGVLGAVWVLALAVPAALIYRNLPQMRLTNGPMLKEYVSQMIQNLPAQGPVIFSDDPSKLFLLESALTQARRGKDCLFLDTSSLTFPAYHKFLKRRYAERWPSEPTKDRQIFYDNELLGIAAQLARSNTLYYLHPSFGYYFEVFYPEPHGLVYKLNIYPTNSVLAPLPNADLIAENEAFWSNADARILDPLVSAITVSRPGKKASTPDLLLERAHVRREINRQATVLATFYSRSLDFWGVELQRAGQLTNAAVQFQRALDLNPDNSVASVNLECNSSLQAGQRIPVVVASSAQDRFGKWKNWDQVMNVNGPFDEPNICYQQGWVFLSGGNYLQAAQQFARVNELALDFLPSRVLLALLYLRTGKPDQALKIAGEIHAHADMLGLTRTNQNDLVRIEASAHLAKNDLAAAEATFNAARADSPKDEVLLATETQVYMSYGRYSNALAVLEQQLQLHPDHPSLLVNQGVAWLQLTNYAQAIPSLTRVVEMETNGPATPQLHYMALGYRAYANLQGGHLDAAQRDYEALQRAFPTGPDAFRSYYGLAEVALRKQDTNTAIRSYHSCLANAPTNSPESVVVSNRLWELAPLKFGKR